MLVRTRFKVNGGDVDLNIEPRRLLVDVLREDLNLSGACTVIVDGKAIKSCTMLAVQADGRDILTIEGISSKGELHPIQRAFIEKGGLQCGFCTPGMIMTAYWLLSQRTDWSEGELRRMLSGNLCRCTGYRGILDAILYAEELMKKR